MPRPLRTAARTRTCGPARRARRRLIDWRNALPYVSRSSMGRVSHAWVVPSSTIGGASSASSSADARPRMTACPRSRKDSTVASSTGWWSPRSITGRTVTSTPVLPPGTTRHPWNDRFTWTLPDVEPTTITPRHAPRSTAMATSRSPACSTSRPSTGSSPIWTSLAQVDAFLVGQEDGRFDIAESGAITFTLHTVLRSDAARRFARHPALSACATTSSVPTSASTGTRPSTSSRRSRAASRGTRTTATRSSSRRSTSRAGSRSPTRRSTTAARRVMPGVHRAGTLRTSVEPIGFECFDGRHRTIGRRRRSAPAASSCSRR